MIKHRLISPLRESLQKGNNLFFVHGGGVKDYFFFNMYEGILSANESYKKFFLEQQNVKTYIYINNKNIICHQFHKGQYQDVSEQYFSIEQEEDVFGDMEEQEVQTKNAQELQRQGEENHTKFTNNFARLVEIIDQSKSKVAIYFEDFEWLAGLYASNQDESLEYIKRIKELSLLPNVSLIVSLEDIELIKKFNFNVVGSHSIYVGNPSSEEIRFSYLRQYLKIVGDDVEIQDNIISELGDIAQAISSSNKDLRASMRIFESVIGKQIDRLVDKHEFEIAVEKILDEKVMLDDVILASHIKSDILNAVEGFMGNEDNKYYRKGLILTGPPGTGKTHLVKALANEKNCFFMAPTLSDLKGEYVGQTSAKVRRIFDQARANQPTIMFIDEADTIFPDRNLAGSTSDSFGLDMVNQFLVEIDGMTTGKQKIFIIAATNRVEVLDSAIKSRLSNAIHIGLPDKIMRTELFHMKLQNHKFLFKEKHFSDEIATKTENMSGRDIDNFIKKLNEKVMESNIGSIANLKDNKETKKIFLEVLKDTEEMLIQELEHKCSVKVELPNEIHTSYEDIIGYEEIKEKIQRQMSHMTADEIRKIEAKRYDVKPKKGILLYGPPGNAKSKLAEATAKQYNLYLVKVLSKDFVSSNLETQLNNLQMIFDKALRLSKMCSDVSGVLLFFDEFDSLASTAILNTVIRGTLLDYLGNEKGIRADDSKVLFMAATNFYDSLDEALIRKGRIDEHIYMNNPTKMQGIKIMEQTFDRDLHVEPLAVSVVQSAYDRLVKYLRDKAYQVEMAKLQVQSLYTIDVQKAHEIIQKGVENITPSGAEIVDLCKELKEEAYYANSFNLKAKTLIINNDIIDRVFATIND